MNSINYLKILIIWIKDYGLELVLHGPPKTWRIKNGVSYLIISFMFIYYCIIISFRFLSSYYIHLAHHDPPFFIHHIFFDAFLHLMIILQVKLSYAF